MHVLFADTGVQTVCVPLRGGGRYSTAQIGYGWQRCHTGGNENEPADATRTVDYPYIQWQIIQSAASKIFLAVDTTCGAADLGHFCEAGSLTKDFVVRLEGILDLAGRPLKGIPPVEICIRPAAATAGDAKLVHMVVDFGNSRTGALLVEMAGEITQTPQMMPFELVNRYHFDAWNEDGRFESSEAARWFSSKTYWCNTPYLPPLGQKRIEYHAVPGAKAGGWFAWRKRPKQVKVEVAVTPPLFDDLSMVRMGREADDVAQVMRADGDIRVGLSSPKRYLWADDASWLEGANWHMADPADRHGNGTYAAPLQGPYLRFVHEDDRDFLLEERPPVERDFAAAAPHKPRHAPRAMMTAAIYEMLCQAYSYVNSIAYRGASGESGRAREIRTLSMTYPSGMIDEERRRLAAQVQKAIKIFAATLGKSQTIEPELNLSLDEASAVHLTYIWSELRLLGQDPRLWFATLRQDRGRPGPEEPSPPEPPQPPPAGSGRGRPGIRRPAASSTSTRSRWAREQEPFGEAGGEIRIGCIDVGGGTTDLMIARYQFEAKIDDFIRGEILHQDGIALGGDQLVKRLLETIIVPAFAEALGLEEEDIQFLFGPEVPRNRELRSQRVSWINRLFVPLAQAYLNDAVDDVRDRPISHTDPELVDPAVLDSLQEVFDKLRGPGCYTVRRGLDLMMNPAEFDGVVHDTFDELLFDYCQRMVEHQADVVLLAGLPSKLDYIQRLVRMYVPLSPSRVVPMHQHYAGNWYPYQDEKGRNPGVIVDPKSPVVVGAAIEFMAKHGMLPQFKFEMKGKARENTYYWGVMTDATSGIRNERILFAPLEEPGREETTEFTTSSQRVIIGRKMTAAEDAQASPVYVLKMDAGDRIDKTEVVVKIRRRRAAGDREECLSLESVSGIVAGEAAFLGENVHFHWRTLADERYYLDTGGLDNIEIKSRG
jgi:hypothetical protein